MDGVKRSRLIVGFDTYLSYVLPIMARFLVGCLVVVADIGPYFINLDALAGEIAHFLVQQRLAAFADLRRTRASGYWHVIVTPSL